MCGGQLLMVMSLIRFTSFPRTEPPPYYIADVVNAFRLCGAEINTTVLDKGLTSNEVLASVRPTLSELGFEIEGGKTKGDKIERPVFYGENGVPALNYQIDAYHPEWRCGLEVEAGRGWMGNAIYRDLIQALVMVNVDHLVLAVANTYKFNSGGKAVLSKDYENTIAVANALYGHTRMRLPYGLTVLGY
jgi:hypothetical protein